MNVRWTRLALGDLQRLHDYLAQDSALAAAAALDRIAEAVSMISRYPWMGREGRVETTREFVVPGTPFIIAYRIKASRIDMLAVIHSSRRWPQSF